MDKYTDRILNKILFEKHEHEKLWCGFYEGKFCKGLADTSKTRRGVKFNRLLRLRRRLST